MKFEGFDSNKKGIYHGLMCDCPQVKTIYPALALIEVSYFSKGGLYVELHCTYVHYTIVEHHNHVQYNART